MTTTTPWRYERRRDRRLRQAQEFQQYARTAVFGGPRPQQPQAPTQSPPEEDSDGGFWGGVKSFADAVTPEFVEDAAKTAVDIYQGAENQLESAFGVLTGVSGYDRVYDPSSGQYVRMGSDASNPLTRTWENLQSKAEGWGDFLQDPVGEWGEAETAFEERLRSPQTPRLLRAAGEGITAPETYPLAVFGGAGAGLLRGSAGAAAPIYRRVGAALIEPVVGGNVVNRFGGEVALETGAYAGSEFLGEHFGTPGSIIGGLLGGVTGAQAPRGLDAIARPGGAVHRGLARVQGRAGREPALGMAIEDVADDQIDDFIRSSYPNATESERRTISDQVKEWRNRHRVEVDLDESADELDRALGFDEPPGEPPRGGVEPPDVPPPEPSAWRYEVPDIGNQGASKALADRLFVMQGELGGNPNSRIRRARGIISPSWAQTDTSRVAWTAARGVEARLASEFEEVMRPATTRIKQLMRQQPPQYIGPPGRKIQGTIKDIADNPDDYVMSPEFKQALEEFGQTMWGATSAKVRSQFGVDVKPYEGKPGSVYMPTVAKRADEIEKVNAAVQNSISTPGRVKRRVYESAAERMERNPDFVPETDLDELVAIHNRAMAQAAGTNTFTLGMGGKTRTELIEELFPRLAEDRQRVVGLVDSLRGRLRTAERRIARQGEIERLRRKDADDLTARRDRHAERMKTRDPQVKRRAAREALADAKSELAKARQEALEAARVMGREGPSGKQRKRLEKLAGRAERMATKYGTGKQTREALERTMELDPGRPRAGELTRGEILEYWDQVRALKAEIREAHLEEMAGFKGWTEVQEEIGETAEQLGRSTDAEEGLKRIKQDFYAAENEAISRARMAGEAEVDAPLVALNKVVNDLEVRIRQVQRELGKADVRKADQEQLAKGLQESLDDVLAERARLRQAFESANVSEHGYVFNKRLSRYLPEEESASVDELLSVATGGEKWILEKLNTLRSTHLSMDASPIWIQTLLGMWQNPKMGVRVASHMIREKPRAALARIAAENPQAVSDFTFYTGKTFGQQTAELGIPRGLRKYKWGREWEDFMFSFVQRMQIESFMNDRNTLLKLNPNMDPRVASREAAVTGSQMIPSLLNMERGISARRSAWERGVFISTSFAMSPALIVKDMTKAAAKLAFSTSVNPRVRWQSLTGREQLSLIRGMTMIGTMTTVAATTAALSAHAHGRDVEKAVKDAMDPTNKKFMSISAGFVPGLPEGAYTPIGGPFRGFVRAMNPVGFPGLEDKIPNWGANKFNSAISGPVRLMANKDWKGDPIREGNALEQFLRSASYGIEQVVPIWVGTPFEGMREGGSLYETGASTIAEFGGANAQFPTPNDRLNQEALNRFDKDSFWDLEPHQQELIREQNPDLWNESVAEGSEERQLAAEMKNQLRLEQQADDQALLSGQITMDEWRKARRDRSLRQQAASEVIYRDSDTPDRDRPIDRYYKVIDEMTVNGRVNWEAVDEWVSRQPKKDQNYIKRNTSLGGTRLEKLYNDLDEERDEYFNLPKYNGYDGDEAREIDDLYDRARAQLNLPRGAQADDHRMLRAISQVGTELGYEPRIIQAARRRVMGMLKQTAHRDQYLRQHPQLAVFMSSNYLTPDQINMLSSA